MVGGSALLRILLLVVVAAVLAGLAQHYWQHDGGVPEAPLVAAPPGAGLVATVRRAEPAAVRPAQPTPTPASAPLEAQEAGSGQAAEPVPPLAREASEPRPNPPAPPLSVREPSEPPAPAPGASAGLKDSDETADVAVDALPRAAELVDLNTGSLADLNRLKGGGAIGRAIVQHRPYAAVDQLLSKRVLSRTTYQKVKDQVTVR